MGKYNADLQYIEVIRDIMKERSLSQQKFADVIGINQTTVSQWLLGNKKPTYDCILSICINFEITPNDFFGFNEISKISKNNTQMHSKIR